MSLNYLKPLNQNILLIPLLLPIHALHAQIISPFSVVQLKPITVTAQKRPENPSNVPVSMTIFSGEHIDNYRINHLDDLSSLIPGLSITQAATTTRIFMRGVGSGANQGFEQSVSIFVDDIYLARTRQLRLPLFDTEQVAVLRGPQGSLFGKNTVAGAINIQTREPTEYFYSDISVFHEIEYNDNQINAVISGPLSQNLNARLAVRAGSTDGFLHNSFNNDEESENTFYSARGKFQWFALPNLTISGKYERNELKTFGTNIQIFEAGPSLPLFSLFDSKFEGKLNQDKSIGGLGNEKSNTFSNLGTLKVQYNLNDFNIISLSGYTNFNFDDNRDVDFSPIPLFFQREDQEYSQFSQEIRLLSPETESFSYIIGAFFLKEDLNNSNNLDANFSLPFIGLPQPATRQIDFNQNSWSSAIFSHASFDITDQLTISAGLRYSYEEKIATQSLQFNHFKTSIPSPSLSALYQAAEFGVPHKLKGKITSSYFTPSASIQYTPLENSMFYATYSEGNKLGGFNEAETFASQSNFEYGSEHSRSFEVGNKNTFLNGTAQFNLNLFYTQYKDLQVSTLNGVNFIVGNAAKSISKGVEAEAKWKITDRLTLAGILNILDSKYKSFKNASCTVAQRLTSNLGSACTQDLSNQTTQFAPDYSGTISLNYNHPLSSKMTLNSQIEMPFTDGFYVTEDLDSKSYQNGFIKLNARISLSSTDKQWEIAVIGRNLTNQLTISHGDDVPLLSGSHFAVIEKPRTVAIEVKLRFQ